VVTLGALEAVGCVIVLNNHQKVTAEWKVELEENLSHLSPCRELAVTLGTCEVVVYGIVLNSRQQVTTEWKAGFEPGPSQPVL
jgi:hypothetical protein